MSKQYFLEKSIEGKASQFEQFRDNIPPYTAIFGLASADITQQKADADYFRDLLGLADTMGAAAQQWTAWKGIALTGTNGSEPALPAKQADFAATVPPGIQTRFLALARVIKNHKSYTTAVGEILGLEGSDQSGPDFATLQPDIDATLNGNRVDIGWGWGGYAAYLDLCEIQVDRADGKGYVLLTYDTTPGYTDTAPFPAAPAKWTYRAIYRLGDQQVGLWSKPVSITVGG